MTKCQSCHHGINSTYIREGVNGSLKKIGYYCNTCNIHYGIDKKLYTVNGKMYTVSMDSQILDKTPIHNNTELLSNAHNTKILPSSTHNKLYNCRESIHKKRARSVVRISRRSSEPQTVGSKPIGPVNHTGSNNSLCIITVGDKIIAC